MTLTPEDRYAIIEYRVERSFNALKEAEYVIDGGYWNLAANRLYYCIFYACEALLLKNGITTQTHAGVSRMIHLHFIKNGILSNEDKNLLNILFRMRQTGDYEDLSDWNADEILPVLPKAKKLHDKIISLILKQD